MVPLKTAPHGLFVLGSFEAMATAAGLKGSVRRPFATTPGPNTPRPRLAAPGQLFAMYWEKSPAIIAAVGTKFCVGSGDCRVVVPRSEEHTSELQSPYVISYA